MKVKELILHCSATPEGVNYTVDRIDKWHKAKGYRKIGYHYYITLDGQIHKGRKDYETGAHCKNHNSIALGICYCGGMDKSMKKPKDTRTPQQKEAMYELCYNLMQKYILTLDDIHCHNEFDNKACPSFSITDFRKEFSEWI